MNAYIRCIKELVGLDTQITVERRDAPAIKGRVYEAGDDGFRLKHRDQHGTTRLITTIDYKDVRGLTEETYDPSFELD